jgi:DNA transformation protein
MAVSQDFLHYVLEQLAPLEGVSARRMFGGVGLYRDGAMFGLIAADVLYYKVDDSNRGEFEARGMRRFRPFADREHLSMSYYEVPAEVLEDAEECAAWAGRSAAIASARQGRRRNPARRLPGDRKRAHSNTVRRKAT